MKLHFDFNEEMLKKRSVLRFFTPLLEILDESEEAKQVKCV